MIYLVHENAPIIDKGSELTINEPRFILSKLSEINSASEEVNLIRASEDIIKLIDGIVPNAVYVEGFEVDDYIPSAQALGLHSPVVTYEELLMKMNGLDNKVNIDEGKDEQNEDEIL